MMFGAYVFEKSCAQYADKILLLDDNELYKRVNYYSEFSAHGFQIIMYADDLSFRIYHEEALKSNRKKMAVIARSNQYIPYDIYSHMQVFSVSMDNLFPKIHPEILENKTAADLDLLSAVYRTNFDDLRKRPDAERYWRMAVCSQNNVNSYLHRKLSDLLEYSVRITNYEGWFLIAEEKAKLDVMAAQYAIELDTTELNIRFQEFALKHFGELSQIVNKNSPVIVSKVMEYVNSYSDKFCLIVMDGMSEFDWQIISESFFDISYEKTSIFAMILSTTSISRQCLLSGKYPVQLIQPWKQDKEKTEFLECAKHLGFQDMQIAYGRNYDIQFSKFVRCGSVIINDVDELVHDQMQGRRGMYNDINVLTQQGELLNLVERLLVDGYDVYITSDHGNTPCKGMGRLVGAGVELETKSRRMLVLKEYANSINLKDKYDLIEYPKYYLPKEYEYLICNVGDSFDIKDETVMTHGGITLDEVVVPFIKIKAVQKNG